MEVVATLPEFFLSIKSHWQLVILELVLAKEVHKAESGSQIIRVKTG